MNMTRNAGALVAQPQKGQWHDLVRARLNGRFDAVARIVSGRKAAAPLEFDLLKMRHGTLSLEVRAGGRRAFLKLFDTDLPDRAYQREKTALCALRESGLVPRILAYSDGPRFLLCEWSAPVASAERNGPGTPVAFARRMGEWLAELDGAVPGETACGNWYTYLRKFGHSLDLGRIAVAREMLSEIPLCGRALSRNDTALTSFLTSAEGHLMGCDFEQAQMRPRGWDYVLGYIGLAEKFPERGAEVLAAYSDGFSGAHRGALIVEELNVVARIVHSARAAAGHGAGNVIAWQ